MTLAPGTKLGPYEILSPIGAGGMGEVYRAHDSRVGRDVAIKVSSEQFSDRFAREIHAVAALNHSNVCTLYDVGSNYLVMELVEGPTLADRIKQGPIPLEESLEIAKQIADALEAAHEKGIVHRDLKPGNIKLRPDGTVKVLDFGLAKVEEHAAVSLETSPTLSVAQTAAGVLLGTAAYMSPEQARGKPVDKRADIWAFGVVLYEMLTGRQLFSGETVSDTLAGVLTKGPEWEKIPPKARLLLRRCLERDPKRRLRDIGEAMAWLEAAPETYPDSAPAKHSRVPWKWVAIPALLLAAIAVPASLYLRRPEPAQAKIFDITVPSMPGEYGMAISPNGRWIAFVALSSESVPCLFVRDIGSGTVRQIGGTERARLPFWSPDNRSIGFFAEGRLKRVAASGGSLQDICSAGESFNGGAWNADGVILFATYPALRRVSAEGGESQVVTTLDRSRKDFAHVHPSFLPDGDHYLFIAASGTGLRNDIYLGSIRRNEQIRLLTGTEMAVYVEPGYLLFQRDNALFAQSFDPDKLALSGESARIADNLLISDDLHRNAVFGASETGLLVYRSTPVQAESQFLWFDRGGKQIATAGEPSSYGRSFDLSPDGKRIAAPHSLTKRQDVWILEWERGFAAPLTTDPAIDACVVWSPDGRRIGFSSNRNGNMDIFVKDATGMGEETPLVASSDDEWLKDWSKDGRYIAYGTTDGSLYILPLFGDRKPFQILKSPFSLNMPSFSYNGKWLAYNSDESGIWQVYVAPFPAADQRRQVSIKGGAQPRWKSDGKELYYLSLDGKMMAVDLELDGKIESGTPHELFNTGLTVDPTNNQYEVTADGRRFLVLKRLTETASIPITVVVDWTALLKK